MCGRISSGAAFHGSTALEAGLIMNGHDNAAPVPARAGFACHSGITALAAIFSPFTGSEPFPPLRLGVLSWSAAFALGAVSPILASAPLAAIGGKLNFANRFLGHDDDSAAVTSPTAVVPTGASLTDIPTWCSPIAWGKATTLFAVNDDGAPGFAGELTSKQGHLLALQADQAPQCQLICPYHEITIRNGESLLQMKLESCYFPTRRVPVIDELSLSGRNDTI